jgi:hypothetical protein
MEKPRFFKHQKIKKCKLLSCKNHKNSYFSASKRTQDSNNIKTFFSEIHFYSKFLNLHNLKAKMNLAIKIIKLWKTLRV